MAEENQMNRRATVSSEAGAIGEQHRQGSTNEMTTRARATGGEVLSDARERLQTLKKDTDAYVRKNPTKAVFVALGIGFVLGLMRRH